MAELHAVTHEVTVDHASVHAGHVRRLAAADPLVAVPPWDATAADTVLVARAGDAAVVATQRLDEHAPDDDASLWGALRSLTLRPFADGHDVEVAWSRLLNRWCATFPDHAEPGDLETAATVTIASHDLALTSALAHHGFAPMVSLVVRPRPGARPSEEASTPPLADVPIRRVRDHDLPQLIELAVDLHAYDARFGMLTARENTRELLATMMAGRLERSRELSWVVDAGDGILAYLQADPPPLSGWVAPLVAASPVAYLNALYVAPSARGRGLGAALTAVAHRELDAAGIEATLLHQAVPNPRSAPFWARQGYRPLWTTWQRRPAVPA